MSICQKKRWKNNRYAYLLWMLLFFISIASPLLAHDGGFGHSRRTIAFFADAQGWIIEYRLKITADEALVQFARMDANGDGEINSAEQKAFFEIEGQRLKKGLLLQSVVGKKVDTMLARFEWGPSLTQTFVYRCEPAMAEFTFDDRNFPHKPGVVQIITGPQVTAEFRERIDIHHAECVPLKVRRSP